MIMFKSYIRRIISLFFKKYRLPNLEGFICVYDKVSDSNIKLYWRKDSYMETHFYRYGLYGNWEKKSLEIWAYLSKQSFNILDIGANTGIYSLIAGANNKKTRIIALEPVEINFNVLNQNIEMNKFPIFAEKIAMSNSEGSAKMYMIKDRLNYMTSVNDNRYELHPEIANNEEIIEIPIEIRSYRFIKEKYNLTDIDLIKIDVEGHELAVIKSLYSQIKLSRPAILIEIIGEKNAQEISSLLANLEYYFFSIDEKLSSTNQVNELWDNDHQNFLICTKKHMNYLRLNNVL
jgi:FkbM family methyltransferase